MESQQPGRVRFILGIGLVVLLSLVPRFAFGAVFDGGDIRVSIDSDRVLVGQRWTLDLVINSGDPLSVHLNPLLWPPGFSVVEGPYVRDSSWEDSAGRMARATKISITVKASQAGIYTLGPFTVSTGKRTLTAPEVTLYVLGADEANRRFPLETRWVIPPGPIYQGQGIPILLQARNLDSLIQPLDLNVSAPGGTLWEKASNLGEIEISSAGEDRIMNIPLAGWMMIPTKPGVVTLPAVSVTIAGIQRSVPAVSLVVLPLPPEAAISRAVGDLTYTTEAHEGQAEQQGQILVTQEIKGTGNFPYLVIPEVQVAGWNLLSRQETPQYRATATGYQGSLLVTWRFTADHPGVVQLTLPGFAALQPVTGAIATWEARTLNLSPQSPMLPLVSPPASAQILDWAGVLAVRPWGIFRHWTGWLWILPGGLFFIFCLFPRSGSKPPRAGLVLIPLLVGLLGAALPAPPPGFREAYQASLSEDPQSAVNAWKALTTANPQEPGLWYNQGLVYQKADLVAEAVFAFRMALKMGFQGPQAGQALRALEERQQLVDPFQSWPGLPEDILSGLLVLAANLSLIFGGLQRRTGKPFWLILVSLAIMLMAVSGILLTGTVNSRAEANAVVGPLDRPLHKVPGELAEPWMTLKAGTVVRILGTSANYSLIQTGYGLEGWILTPNLLLLEEAKISGGR